jgi:hypothetical protein
MSGGLCVTPWRDSGEWNHVRQLVLNRDPAVLKHFAGDFPFKLSLNCPLKLSLFSLHLCWVKVKHFRYRKK